MSDTEDLYDEFGNYIGPDLESSDESGSEDGEDEDSVQHAPDDASDVSEENGPNGKVDAMVVRDEEMETAEPMSAVVLHEDKEHYLSAEQVYGEDVRTAVLDEDAMELETPLVEPVIRRLTEWIRP